MLPKLLDFVFPRICVGCGDWGFDLCLACLNKIKVHRKKIISPKPLDGVTSIFEYSGIIEKIIKEIKFEFAYDRFSELIELAVSCLGEDKDFTKNFDSKMILVPVPLHPARLRWRGFNQSEILGKSLAKKLKIKITPKLLQRTKNTQAQSLLKKEDRQKNIKNAFVINPNVPKDFLKNCKIVLFDDIWTTGSTMIECAKVLKQNGVKFIWGVTLAG
jgi:ComF family protein